LPAAPAKSSQPRTRPILTSSAIPGVAVVGAGILGSRHARVLHERPDVRLVAVADLNEVRAREVAARHGARGFEDYAAMMRELGPQGSGELDAVTVATPDFLHLEPVSAALEAGLDVFVEKPLAMTLDEARRMATLARERGRLLVVNYSQRWLPEHRRVESLVRDGGLGRVAFVESHRWDAAWVPERMISWAARTTPIHFMSSHDIDLIIHWLGERVETVQAVAHRGALAAKGLAAVVDGYAAILRFRSGAVASLHSSWILPETFPAAADAHLEVIGSAGALWLEGNAREMRLYAGDRSEKLTFGGPVTATEVNGKLEGAFTESLRAFLAAARQRDLDPPTSASRTLHVVEVQEAIVRAAESGSTVRLPDGEPT
jgi:predicted dehydrogenase